MVIIMATYSLPRLLVEWHHNILGSACIHSSWSHIRERICTYQRHCGSWMLYYSVLLFSSYPYACEMQFINKNSLFCCYGFTYSFIPVARTTIMLYIFGGLQYILLLLLFMYHIYLNKNRVHINTLAQINAGIQCSL